MLRITLFSAFCLVSTSFFSQTAESIQEKTINVKGTFETTIISPEVTGTYEEQGFKKTMIDQKIIYRKEINGVIIEFTPKEQ